MSEIQALTPEGTQYFIDKVKTDKESTFRFTTMPTASASLVGQIIQYTGVTTQTYTNGYFYKCEAQGTSPETYAWVNKPVQEGGGSKEDKFRFTTMPETSAQNEGKIYQYIGQTNDNFTEGYSYKSDYAHIEYIGDVSDFECSGSNRNYVISTDSITMKTVQNEAQETIVKCIVPMVNKGTLKITKTRVSGDRLNYIYTELGTTSGGNDLYTSSNWNTTMPTGSTVVEEIDLSQYNASEIYLSFHMVVDSGNNSVFEISSIEQSYRQWKEEEVSRQPQQFTSAEMMEIKNAVSQETANVNITPYHIYDTDEHVVGEWRQIVDGVKKKKPVYETVFVGNSSPIITGITNIEREVDFSCTLDGIILGEHYTSFGGYYKDSDGYEAIAFHVYKNNTSKIQVNTKNFTSFVGTFTLQYTKTTDEWETVE